MPSLPVNARGRASRSNDSSRFNAFTRGSFDDGWTEEDGEPAQLETTLTAEKAPRHRFPSRLRARLRQA